AVLLVALGGGGEAIPMTDECLRCAAGQVVDPRLIPTIMGLRMKHFRKQEDVAECRATAEMWEKLNRPGAMFLLDAAWNRAIVSAVIRAADQSASAAKVADEEADRAMAWLRKAVAAGVDEATRLEKGSDVTRAPGR